MTAYLPSLFGGMLIGAAAALLLLVSGRIAGISGMLGRLLVRDAGPHRWRLAFLAGLVLAPLVAGWAGWASPAHLQGGLLVAATAGLLTGLGTGFANGCTSGHGICGLANLSPRSLVAVLTFMAVAALTVFAVRHVL